MALSSTHAVGFKATIILYCIKISISIIRKYIIMIFTRYIHIILYNVEKFHSCYRDGLEGGKDLRSSASLYFFIRILTFLVIAVQTEVIFFSL